MNEKIRGLIIILLSYLITIGIGLLSFMIMNNEKSLFEDIDYNIQILIKIFISNVISTFVIWFIGVLLDTASTYDAYWSVQTPVIFIGLLVKEQNINIGNFIYLELILFWAIRLTYNYTKTFHDITYMDWRYKQLKEKTGKFYQLVNFFGICLFPTIIVYVASLPAFLYILNDLDFQFYQIFGCILMFVGTILELKADNDIHEFKKIRNDRKEIINIGLWKYCRHPNYLGEILFWYGVAVFYIFDDFSNNWYIILGAILNNALFLGISIPMAEKHLKEYKEGYDEYIERVSKLIPLKCPC